jgi:hypothetical protein
LELLAGMRPHQSQAQESGKKTLDLLAGQREAGGLRSTVQAEWLQVMCMARTPAVLSPRLHHSALLLSFCQVLCPPQCSSPSQGCLWQGNAFLSNMAMTQMAAYVHLSMGLGREETKRGAGATRETEAHGRKPSNVKAASCHPSLL